GLGPSRPQEVRGATERRWPCLRFRCQWQDIDIRCVRMCTINLAFRGLHGLAIHGDTLRNERRLAYQTGFNGKGFVREVPIEELPAPPVPAPTRLSSTRSRRSRIGQRFRVYSLIRLWGRDQAWGLCHFF